MDPQNFPYYLLAGVWFSILWLALIYGRLKAMKHDTETLCKMTEYQNQLIAHSLNQQVTVKGDNQ